MKTAVSKPLSSTYKTKFQYFKEVKKTLSPNQSLIKIESFRKSPSLFIQIPNEGDNIATFGSILSPSTLAISSTKSQTTKNLNLKQRSKMKAINTTEYSPSMQMR